MLGAAWYPPRWEMPTEGRPAGGLLGAGGTEIPFPDRALSIVTGSSVQPGTAALVSDSLLVLNGLLVGDRLKPRIQVLPRNRAGRFSKTLERRRGFAAWSMSTPGDTRFVTATGILVADSVLVASGTAVAPNLDLGVAQLLADSSITFPATRVPGDVQVAMLSNSLMAALGNFIAKGAVVMQADSALFAQGTGGSAGPFPATRHGGIVSIGIRGGHS